MAKPLQPGKDGPGGESSINVRSLRMKFEHADCNVEGVPSEKSIHIEIAKKTSDSIKKFESLSKVPGFKLSDSLDRSLSKAISAKGSVRVGSLRHKFESLANRSLSADLFNAPGESDEEQDSNSAEKQVPLCDHPESDAIQAPQNFADTNSLPVEGEVGLTHNPVPENAEEDAASSPESTAQAQGESAADDLSTFTFTSEESCEEPALCLKEEIEKAEADEMRRNSPNGQDEPISAMDGESPEAKDTHVESADNMWQNRAHPKEEIAETSENASNALNNTNPTSCNATDVFPQADPGPVDLPGSECQGNKPLEAKSEMAVELESSINERREVAEGLHDELVEIPANKGENRSDSRKPRGFFQRLFVCGTTA